MKFQLIGKINYWEEVHTDSLPGSTKILEEFEAINVNLAIERARELVRALPANYPVLTEWGSKKFEGLEAGLRVVNQVWNCSVKPKEKSITQIQVAKKMVNVLTETDLRPQK